jgi:quercetin dioxygenase-like cupin family protein
MERNELKKATAHITTDMIDYIANSVVSKTIIKKITGSISAMAFDEGEGWAAKISPFDTFAQIIEGQAVVVIEESAVLLQTGQSIIIPAHKSNKINPNGRFKMILTIIKHGYE